MTRFEDLSPEQQSVVQTWGQGMAVLAGAGSGKTTTLVIKCEELLKRNPQAKIAAVSFTERSAGDLRSKLSERLSAYQEDPLACHWVMTIHGLCGSIIRENPRLAGLDGEESMLSETESQLFWERAIESLWLDELPLPVEQMLDILLERETRESIATLLKRVRSLRSFGALESLAQSKDPASQALERVSRYTMERYDRLKQRQGALDFDDLERGADLVLRDPEVCCNYQKRFDLVLVDEFQDTNPVQARILKRFVRPDASNLCVVGDPKQSIYRFRDADVTVFEDFCAELAVRKSLTWNFRSRPAIIEFANEVCAPLFAAAGMNYEALVSKRPPGDLSHSVVKLDVAAPAALAAWVQSQVSNGIPLDSMALLLRKIRGNEKWLKALTSAGIPIAVGSGGMFWEDPRVRELVGLLRWWDNPGQVMSGAVFLRAPWVGVPDAQLDEWLTAKPPRLMEGFLETTHPLAEVLKSVRGQSIRPGELLLRFAISSEIEDELGMSLLGLWHRCEELSSRGLDFHAVVCELSRAVQEGRRERDVPPPKNLGQLRILTLHSSKGLEFPHVILVDFGEKGRASDTPLLYWNRNDGALLGGRDSDGERTHKDDPIESSWRERERAQDLAESMRLFYVALTRAKERLVLVCPPVKEFERDTEVFKRDHWRGWIEVGGGEIPVESGNGLLTSGKATVSGDVGLVKSTRESRIPVKPRLVRPRHSVTEWNLLSRCPRAYEWTYIRPLVSSDFEERQKKFEEMGAEAESTGDFPRPAGFSFRELGTKVHACLETGDFESLRALEAQVGRKRFSAEPLIKWASESPLMTSFTGGESWNELAFEVAVFGENLVGSIDRVVCERRADSSLYTIVDFKVTASEKSREALIEAYSTQMNLYAGALDLLTTGENKTIQTVLVNIAPTGVQVVDFQPLPIQKGLPELAAGIVAGSSGAARPGVLCQVCTFREHCM